MKISRVLMVFVFLLVTVVVSPVQAAGGQKVSFIRLLTSVDAKSPIEMQARVSYNRIKPQLLALQKQGVILEFQPELKAGLVKVLYASASSQVTAFAQYQAFDNIHDAMVTGGSTRLTSGAPEALTASIYVDLYNSCFFGSGLGVDSEVIGSLRDKTGRVIASADTFADGGGNVQDCFPWSGSYTDIQPGYTLTFKSYDTSTPTPALLGTFSAVVPSVSFTSINSAKAVVRGTGPAGKPFTAYWTHRNLNAGDTLAMSTKAGTIAANGTWFKDMSTGKISGNDYLELEISLPQTNSTFVFHFDMVTPYIYCQLGGNYCDLSGFPFQPATMSIIHAGTTYTFSGTFDADGSFHVTLENKGDPIFLKAGDKVNGTGVPVYTLPALTGAVNFSTDVVHGKVPANRYFDVYAYILCSCTAYNVYSHSDATGNYSSNFYSQVDLLKIGATNIEIYFMDKVTGNVTDYFKSFVP